VPLDLDFGGVERPSFDPIPENDYVLRVESVEIKKSKNPNKGGNHFDVAHCVFAVAEGEFEDRKVFHYQGFDTESLPYAKVMFEAILGEPLDGIQIDEEDLEGRTFEAHVGQRADNRDKDKMQNVIKYFILPFEVE
jgi:hypothetical protein